MTCGGRLWLARMPGVMCNCNQQPASILPNFVCRYGVKYPALYASGSDDNANAFNCVQRGHQNSLEQLPHFFAVFLPSAIKVHHYAYCHTVTSERRSDQLLVDGFTMMFVRQLSSLTRTHVLSRYLACC